MDWSVRNSYTGIGVTGTDIMRLEGGELLYWDCSERNSYTDTGGRGTAIPGLF
jgi:hypothetical protein